MIESTEKKGNEKKTPSTICVIHFGFIQPISINCMCEICCVRDERPSHQMKWYIIQALVTDKGFERILFVYIGIRRHLNSHLYHAECRTNLRRILRVPSLLLSLLVCR